MTARAIGCVGAVEGPAGLAGGRRHRVGAARRGDREDLFDDAAPMTLVWLRLATSALVLAALARPTLRGRTRGRLAGGDRVRGGARDHELGDLPVVRPDPARHRGDDRVPRPARRSPSSAAVAPATWSGSLLAAIGVGLLGLERGDLNVAGVAFALLAAAAWTAYILLSASTGRRWPGLDGLTVASVVATVMLTPFLVAFSGRRGLGDPDSSPSGALVGLLSSVIPYSCEITALRTIRPSVFGILMSLEPAAAALAGMLVVGEFLTAVQWLAIGLRGRGERRRHPVRVATRPPRPSTDLSRQCTRSIRVSVCPHPTSANARAIGTLSLSVSAISVVASPATSRWVCQASSSRP